MTALGAGGALPPARRGALVRLVWFLCVAVVPGAHGEAGADDAVITVNGFCGRGAAQPPVPSRSPTESLAQSQSPTQPQPQPRSQEKPCQTVVTRAEFEKLTQALDPGMPAELRLKVAEAYARVMRMAADAEDRGLDRTPAFAEEMRYARLQLLSQDLSRVLREEAGNISEIDVSAYYQENRASFEQVTLARIFVPRAKRGPVAAEEEMLRVAADLRARAVRGADPDELEGEAYKAAGIPGVAPHTRIENVRPSSLPPSHEGVMSLGIDEVSEVVTDPEGGHFIYKMLGKEMLSVQEAGPEIRKLLSERRYAEATRGFSGGVVFDDGYFAVHGEPRRHQRERRGGEGR